MGGPVRSFHDLDVYNASYGAMLSVFRHILPGLPASEKTDLVSQLSRSSKAVPRLIAEGHSKRHQKRGFQKYIDDAMAESNETNVSLCQARDIYGTSIDGQICDSLIREYDKISRQLYNLGKAWSKFGDRQAEDTPTPTSTNSSCATPNPTEE